MKVVMQKYSNYCHENSLYFVTDSERGKKTWHLPTDSLYII
jgi:hypothetical protein